jgi:hypothetical protein
LSASAAGLLGCDDTEGLLVAAAGAPAELPAAFAAATAAATAAVAEIGLGTTGGTELTACPAELWPGAAALAGDGPAFTVVVLSCVVCPAVLLPGAAALAGDGPAFTVVVLSCVVCPAVLLPGAAALAGDGPAFPAVVLSFVVDVETEAEGAAVTLGAGRAPELEAAWTGACAGGAKEGRSDGGTALNTSGHTTFVSVKQGQNKMMRLQKSSLIQSSWPHLLEATAQVPIASQQRLALGRAPAATATVLSNATYLH